MADGFAQCIGTALAAAVAELDASRLSKVEIIVSQPRGVPAGSVTIVAHARAPSKSVVVARQRDVVVPQQNQVGGRAQRGSASQRQHADAALRILEVYQAHPPYVEEGRFTLAAGKHVNAAQLARLVGAARADAGR